MYFVIYKSIHIHISIEYKFKFAYKKIEFRYIHSSVHFKNDADTNVRIYG